MPGEEAGVQAELLEPRDAARLTIRTRCKADRQLKCPKLPTAEVWEAMPLTDEQRRNGINVIPPAMRPRVVFRYADTKDLFISGLLDGGDEIAQHPMIVDVPSGQGHIVLFSNNPMWRGQTKRKLFPRLQCDPEFRQLERGSETRRELRRVLNRRQVTIH